MHRRSLLLAAAFLPAAVRAGDPAAAAWNALKAGGIAILLRHAQTVAGLGDPPGFRIGECSTQRNLSDEGRRQAERIGSALAAGGVRVDAVLSSRWCRCLDTARLAFPTQAVEPFPPLDSFFSDRSREAEQTRATRARIAAVRAPANVAFVTHHVNILALTGQGAGAGEAVLVDATGAVRGRLRL